MTSASLGSGVLSLKICEKRFLTEDICLFVLRDDRERLPAFQPGAHIHVRTPSGVFRRYSLCESPSVDDRYVIAVKREANGLGASRSMVNDAAVGGVLVVGRPENYFPIVPTATRHLLIAGGIGITPIISMARFLFDEKADFRLVYCTRSPQTTAFRDELSASPFSDRISFHHDLGDRAAALDFVRLLSSRERGDHVYCCGPRSLMEAVRSAARNWPSGHVHFEDFGTADKAVEEEERSFYVRLARSGNLVHVPAGKSILEALRSHCLDAPSSCESGTCGTCRTTLLQGLADHRDFVLDDDEKDSNIMICVSRALSNELVLDL